MAGADSACLLFENQSSWYRASFPEMGDSSNLSGTALAALVSLRCTFYVPLVPP